MNKNCLKPQIYTLPKAYLNTYHGKTSCLGYPRMEGAQLRPLSCLLFFFLDRPLFSFLISRALFLRAIFFPPFFLFYNIFGFKSVFFKHFFRIFARALFTPSCFYYFESALFFLFPFGGRFFLCPLFALFFFVLCPPFWVTYL